jgi:hypothetical protein
MRSSLAAVIPAEITYWQKRVALNSQMAAFRGSNKLCLRRAPTSVNSYDERTYKQQYRGPITDAECVAPDDQAKDYDADPCQKKYQSKTPRRAST